MSGSQGCCSAGVAGGGDAAVAVVGNEAGTALGVFGAWAATGCCDWGLGCSGLVAVAAGAGLSVQAPDGALLGGKPPAPWARPSSDGLETGLAFDVSGQVDCGAVAAGVVVGVLGGTAWLGCCGWLLGWSQGSEPDQSLDHELAAGCDGVLAGAPRTGTMSNAFAAPAALPVWPMVAWLAPALSQPAASDELAGAERGVPTATGLAGTLSIGAKPPAGVRGAGEFAAPDDQSDAQSLPAGAAGLV